MDSIRVFRGACRIQGRLIALQPKHEPLTFSHARGVRVVIPPTVLTAQPRFNAVVRLLHNRHKSPERFLRRPRRMLFVYGLGCLDHFACNARTWPGNCFRACVQQRWRPSKRRHEVARCRVSTAVRGHGTVPTVRWRDRIRRTSGTAGDEKTVAGLQPSARSDLTANEIPSFPNELVS